MRGCYRSIQTSISNFCQNADASRLSVEANANVLGGSREGQTHGETALRRSPKTSNRSLTNRPCHLHGRGLLVFVICISQTLRSPLSGDLESALVQMPHLKRRDRDVRITALPEHV